MCVGGQTSSSSETHRVCVVDLLHVPLLVPSEREEGNGSVRAAAGQDEAEVVGSPADGVHWTTQTTSHTRNYSETQTRMFSHANH